MKKWKITQPLEDFKTIVQESKKKVIETPEVSEAEARRIVLDDIKKNK